MPFKLPRSAVLMALLAVLPLALLGCGPPKAAGISTGGTTWMIVNDNPIPGIHEGTASVMTLTFGPPTGVKHRTTK